MTIPPADLKRRIKALGLTQHEFARLCGIRADTLRRYLMDPDRATQARPAHPTVVRVLEWMERPGRPDDWPER